MTRQYMVGELSLILEELQAVPLTEAAARDVVRLRREVESTAPTALAGVAARAVELAELVCWESLARGDTATFAREAAIGAELWEFGVCAGLLPDDQSAN
jgi:hypothetical protein